jgi:hypothetical protein
VTVVAWTDALDKYIAVERMADAAHSGLIDYKKAMEIRKELMRAAGFLQPIDEEFAMYFEQNYKRHRQEFKPGQVIQFPDGQLELREAQLLKLKRKLKEAVSRLSANVGA